MIDKPQEVMSVFEKIYDEMIFRAVEKYSLDIISNHQEYRELSERNIIANRKLRNLIPQQASELQEMRKQVRECLEEIDSTEAEMQGILMETLYEQGLKDGIRLAGLLNIYSQK
ncbi:MAG: hypothetical protein H0Z28_12755 [Archaeoglobus sp.]|nr:hypothetical protein [Archaeoglobus sp.]